MEFHHFADDDQGRWLDVVVLDQLRQGFQIADVDLLLLGGALLDQGRRGVGGQAVFDKLGAQALDLGQAHVEDHGLAGLGDGVPVGFVAVVLEMAQYGKCFRRFFNVGDQYIIQYRILTPS